MPEKTKLRIADSLRKLLSRKSIDTVRVTANITPARMMLESMPDTLKQIFPYK